MNHQFNYVSTMFIGGGMAQQLYTTMLKNQTYKFLFYYILMGFQLELTKWEQLHTIIIIQYKIVMDYFWKFSEKSIDEYDKDIDLMFDTLHTYCCNTWMTLL